MVEKSKSTDKSIETEKDLEKWEKELTRQFSLSYGFTLIIWAIGVIIQALNISLVLDYIAMILIINVGVSFIQELVEWVLHNTLKFTHMLLYFIIIDGLEIALLYAISGLI